MTPTEPAARRRRKPKEILFQQARLRCWESFGAYGVTLFTDFGAEHVEVSTKSDRRRLAAWCRRFADYIEPEGGE